MYMLQGLLAAVLLAAHVTALASGNDTSFNTTHAVTITTTVTPIVTVLVGPNFTNVMSTHSQRTVTVIVTITIPCSKVTARHADNEPFGTSQIGTTSSSKDQSLPAFVKGMTVVSGANFMGKPFPSSTDPPMAYEAVVTSSGSFSTCNNAIGNFGFNRTNNCSSSAQTSTTSANIPSLMNTLTVFSSTSFPPVPPVSSDVPESTSTTVVVVSLVTSSPTPSATSASVTTSNSAAHPRPQPVRAFFWLSWVVEKARGQVLNAFGDWAKAEKAKSLLSMVPDEQLSCDPEGEEGRPTAAAMNNLFSKFH